MKPKKASEPFDHWKELVEVFFSFTRSNLGQSPSFDRSAPKDMREILFQIRKRAEEQDIPWTLDVAKTRWTNFLTVAIRDPWLKTHWLLSNLSKNKDVIFFKASAPRKPNVKSNQTELPSHDIYDFI